MNGNDYRRKVRLGVRVFAGLLALDVLEYVVGVSMRTGSTLPLAILALPTAWLIMRYYMHIQQVRRGGEA